MGDGKGSTRIAGGIYENDYVLENGTWKFAKLHYWRQFDGDYEKGWRNSDNALLPVVPYHFTPDSVGVPIPDPSAPRRAPASGPRTCSGVSRRSTTRTTFATCSTATAPTSIAGCGATSLIASLPTVPSRLPAWARSRAAPASVRPWSRRWGPRGWPSSSSTEHPLWETIVEVQAGGKTAIARGMEYAMIGNAPT